MGELAPRCLSLGEFSEGMEMERVRLSGTTDPENVAGRASPAQLGIFSSMVSNWGFDISLDVALFEHLVHCFATDGCICGDTLLFCPSRLR